MLRRLLQSQYPQWSELPIERIVSAGTDNAIYRLGDDLAVRLPRIHWAVEAVVKERGGQLIVAAHSQDVWDWFSLSSERIELTTWRKGGK